LSSAPDSPLFPDAEATLEISPQAVSQLLAKRADTPFLFLDCREADEYNFCRIEGSRLLPLSGFSELSLEHLPEDKAAPIVVYCHHGVRSAHAAQFLRAQGYPNTFSMQGGIEVWSLQIDPEVPRY